MKILIPAPGTVLFVCLLALTTHPLGATGGRDTVRGAIEHYFSLLKNGHYDQIYDLLPEATQKKSSRPEMVAGLSRLAGLLRLEKIEIDRVEQKNGLAVATTTIYGTLTNPVTLNGEAISRGRIISQQYLVRERRFWKIASINERSLRLFLQENPAAGSLFPQAYTRLEVLSAGQWMKMPGSR
ncbi:MAG: hypothetical protein ACOYLF_09425 [Blastocatellia bacterium]|jgi:hypothetical protein